MAGGEHAAALACWRCAERADRVSEGTETDWYSCSACGFRFGVDFDASGPADEALWPPKPEERARILEASRHMAMVRVIEKVNELVPGARVPVTAETELAHLAPTITKLRWLIGELHSAFGARVDWNATSSVNTVGDLAGLIVRSAPFESFPFP